MPFNCTVASSYTVCGGPAFATGGRFWLVMVTVDGVLLLCPLLTMSWTL